MLSMNLWALFLCLFVSCGNELAPTLKKPNCQILYEIESDVLTNHNFDYNGELTDTQISGIYRMTLSTYGDCGFYKYVTFDEPMTEKQIKSLALEFANRADEIVRSQYKIPNDIWPGYTEIIVRVYYIFDTHMKQVAEYDYLK